MRGQRQDHDATMACACVRACECGAVSDAATHVRCMCPATIISGRHVTYVSSARGATMEYIVCVPAIVLLKAARHVNLTWQV